ncbi:TIGR03016 family PEP-CTERM system-associated outer membrane protein [Pelotalea chapellei]|uniref:TIGR03016 family PEP-CTERM system-associated outer membrane protein n=1 Tax=Pelotalea chapellei TaxID=44671 RepID=A0ABS5U5A6_9BACT|nr:TIGR03016 family PEP-CTERM system-associated outer membrane protein [Pelotalea chapellei]MBT1070860.1 TIGR03016 family PEP-CTERM system-associated outer membrane protein [Pelotalea chapellei]
MSRLQKAVVTLGICAVAGSAQGADFKIIPSLTVGEEFTDNVHETKDNHVSEFITRLLPGVAAQYKAPNLMADLGYVLDYRYYARNKRKNDLTHDLAAKGNLTVVDNFFYIEASESYQRSSLNVTRDVTRESLTLDQTDRNLITAAPYFEFRPGQRTTLTTGYRFIDTRYSQSSAVDKTDHVGFLEARHELSARWSLTAEYTFTRELSKLEDFNQHQAAGGFRYEYLEKSYLFAQMGHTWTNYDSGRRLNGLFWDAGATHDFGNVAATVTTGVRYDDDPLHNISQETFVAGKVEKRLQTGLLGLSLYYSEFTKADTDRLETIKYGAAVKGTYQFTDRLTGALAFTAEKYEDKLLDTYTRLLLLDYGLSYLLAEKLTVGLSHIHVNSYSPANDADNRRVNRVTLLVTKQF